MQRTGYFVRFELNLNFLERFLTPLNTKFHENSPSGSLVVHVDGRTDVTKLIVPFRNFVNAPKKRPLQNCLAIRYSEHVQLNLTPVHILFRPQFAVIQLFDAARISLYNAALSPA